MQPEPKIGEPLSSPSGAEGTITCANCRTVMPRQMRFCRSCGFRLGEGLSEYVETVRLPNQPPPAAARDNTRTAIPKQPQARVAAADLMSAAQNAHRAADQALQQASAGLKGWEKRHGRKRTHWIVWLILALFITSVAGGGLISGLRSAIHISQSTPRSYVGTNTLKNGTGGATFDYVTPPGGPADKAGLLGGDIITSFDGQPVKTSKDFYKLLEATPIGKTVPVTFIRDGETKQTQMTTMSEDQVDALDDAFDDRPEGKGYIAEGTDIDVVPAPGTNHNGVRLNKISKNRPADIAGLRDGDIVIEFDGLPMRTRRELETRIIRAIPGSTVKVVVIRGSGERVEIPVKIGNEDD